MLRSINTVLIGQNYPVSLFSTPDSAIMQFLCEGENVLIVKMSRLTSAEFLVLKTSNICAGYEHCKTTNTLHWLVIIGKGKKELLFDGQFNPRLKSVTVPDLTSSKNSSGLKIHVVDELNVLRLVRVVDFPTPFFNSFVYASKKLLSKKECPTFIRTTWDSLPLAELKSRFRLHKMRNTSTVHSDNLFYKSLSYAQFTCLGMDDIHPIQL